jgi:hypothetical protein
MKELIMTRHVRLWIAGILAIVATVLAVGLIAVSQTGLNQTHTIPLAGIIFNGID